MTIFFDKLKNVIGNRELIKLVISNLRDHDSDLQRIIVTPVELKKGVRLNFVYRYKTRDITKNHGFEEALPVIKKALEEEFYNADLFAVKEHIQLSGSSGGKTRIKTGEPVLHPAISFRHDRTRERIITAKGNIYLRELGILDSSWEVRREMGDKYVQINKYIELIGPVIKELQLPGKFHVADMGSGKGYLTFALYDFLANNLRRDVIMTGVESRDELVRSSNEIAKMAEFKNLRFITGTIKEAITGKIDILIALHACDTATDEAIFRGITSGASLIVCSPCCHKQLRKEFHIANELRYVLKHGILKEREAEIVTDGLRALIMEEYGYKTRIFEFISTEHTPKNLMITGRKVNRPSGDSQKIKNVIRKIKEFYGIKQHFLETLLKDIPSPVS